MKKMILAMMVVTLAAVACSKDTETPRDVTGTWQWLRSVGGVTGQDTLLPAPNTTVLLTLKPDGTYQRTANGQTTAQGTFVVEEVTSIFSTEKQPAIRFDNASAGSEYIIGWDNGHLVLVENHTEPYGSVYKRVSP